MAEINLISIGLALIIIGFLIVVISSLSGKDVKVGFGGFVGPIPFGWANDPETGKWIIVITAIVAIVFLVAALRGIGI